MKNSIKSFLFIFSLLIFLVSCSEIASYNSDIVDFKTTDENTCLLSIYVDQNNCSRTINPQSLSDDENSLTSFVLKGVSVTTGGEFSKDITTLLSGSPAYATYEIPYGMWLLTLEAGNGSNVWLKGEEFVNLKTHREEITFVLKADNLGKTGFLKLKGTYKDAAHVANFCEAGLYKISDGQLKKTISLVLDEVSSPLYSFETEEVSDIPAGRYLFKINFYNSNDEDTRKLVGYWEDIVVIASGRKTERTDIECNEIICQPPKKPETLKAYEVNNPDIPNGEDDYFTVRFIWDDSSTNEESFVLTINECKDKNDKDLKEGGISLVYTFEDGNEGLKAGSTQCEIRLPCNKYFIASVKAKNFVGDSEACDYDHSKISNSPSGTKKFSGQTIWYTP